MERLDESSIEGISIAGLHEAAVHAVFQPVPLGNRVRS
jgi:hypothetical protein